MNTHIIFSKSIIKYGEGGYSRDSCKVIIFGKTLHKLWSEPITISPVTVGGYCNVSVIRNSVERTHNTINDREIEYIEYDVEENIMRITEEQAKVLRTAMDEYEPDPECVAIEAAAIAKYEAIKASNAAFDAEHKDVDEGGWTKVTK